MGSTEKVNINLASLCIDKENVWMTIAIHIGDGSRCPLRARCSQRTEMPYAVSAAGRKNCQRTCRTIGIDKIPAAVVTKISDADQRPSGRALRHEFRGALQMRACKCVGDNLASRNLRLVKLS